MKFNLILLVGLAFLVNANAEMGEGRVIRCLKEHESQLSPACKEKRAEKKRHPKEARVEARKAKIEAKLKAIKAQKIPPPAPGTAPAAQ